MLLASNVLSAPPNITNVIDYPDPAEFIEVPEDVNVTIVANVSDPDDDLDTVLLSFISPIQTNYTMSEVSPGTFQYVFVPKSATTYYYYIYANDTTGNETISPTYNFTVRGVQRINITVEILPYCCFRYSFFFVPEFVIQGQIVGFIAILENCGNIELNRSWTDINITNSTNHSVGYSIDTDLRLARPFEEIPFFYIWDSDDLPLGTYYANTTTYYYAYYNDTLFCNDTISWKKEFNKAKKATGLNITPSNN